MKWFSVRMRAAEGGSHEAGGAHISGGELLVPEDQVEEMVQALLQRAMTHEKGKPSFVNLTVEEIPWEEVGAVTALHVAKHPVSDLDEGRETAVALLQQAGVAEQAARKAVALLASGAAPDGGAMRGAVVMDADSGERLEADFARGVRVSRIDWHPFTLKQWKRLLSPQGIANERVAEALALASKVCATPGTVAELCWSDDPGYVAGYVASPQLGYVRLPFLKEIGSPLGGRVFFVRGVENPADYEAALNTPSLVTALPQKLLETSGEGV